MPKRKKQPTEWTTEEAMKKLFPKKVRDELNRVAHEKDADKKSSESRANDNIESP